MTNLTYIIPPYLLNTCLGSELKNKLALKNEELSTRNVIATDSKYYQIRAPPKKSNYTFSSNPFLNDIIELKVFYKLAMLGVLGNNPSEFGQHDSRQIYEYYTMFEDRLLGEDSSSINYNDGILNTSLSKMQSSIFSSTTDGEVNLVVPPEYTKYMNRSLKELILEMKLKESHRFSKSSSFLQFDDHTFFDYPLPICWLPLIQSKHLDYLTDAYNLKTECAEGYSNISMVANPKYKNGSGAANGNSAESDSELPPYRDRYYNFISEKSVSSSTGIYYYEVEVEQEVTDSTGFLPLLAMNDTSLSSDSALSLSTGYTKRFVTIEQFSPPANPIQNDISTSTRVDLEYAKQELFNGKLKEQFHLEMKPGEFTGSFAVNFEDSSFYNSVKNHESAQRTTILNMNRRLSQLNRSSMQDADYGKVDIGVPFKTHLSVDSSKKKIYKTDVVGCGVNFINKSIFVTLNGILVKVIPQDELVSAQPSSNNLFGSKTSDNSVYPIIGFKIKEPTLKTGFEPSKVVIKGNFGFKEFKFNISNYVKNFKIENQRFLYLSLLDKIETNRLVSTDSTSTVEKSLLNLNDDSKMLNSLIKGYLNHQGYLKTFNSFTKDLTNLANETSGEKEEPSETIDEKESNALGEDDERMLLKSHAINRNVIKSYLMANQFDNLFRFLSINYPRLVQAPSTGGTGDFQVAKTSLDIPFELKILKFTFLLKNYVERKLNVDDFEFEFEFKSTESEADLYEKSLAYRSKLQADYRSSSSKIQKINELSSVFLVNNHEGLKNLPKVLDAFQNYSKNLVKIASMINVEILKSVGLNALSNLEQIFENVDENIRSLSFGVKDDKFMLVNFERDHMDL